MKFLKLQLHVQIMIGMVLGAAFGGIFHADTHSLLVHAKVDGREREIRVARWEWVELRTTDSTVRFGTDDQLLIISRFKSLPNTAETQLVVATGGKETIFANVVSVAKEGSIATAIKPVGDIFIRLLMMIAIPLVFASLAVGTASLRDFKRMARIGGKTITIYLTTTAIAIVIGLALGNIIQPGHRMDETSRARLMAAYEEDAESKIDPNVNVDIVDYLVNLVPKNPIGAMADGEMLQIIVFAVLFGMGLIAMPEEKSKPALAFLEAVSDAMIKLVDVVMKIAPIAVFALIAAVIAEFGFGILQTLIWYIVTVLAGFVIHLFGTYPAYLKVLVRRYRLRDFFRNIRPAQLVAFTTSSSAATLPINFECCENMGAPKSVTSFTLPLGATINMDGTALYQGVATLFIAQVFGMELTFVQQLSVVFTAVLASIGTAPIPGVGIVMLVIILKSVGVPEHGIALILGVDRILDMCRTVLNVTGDAMTTIAVAGSEGVLQPPKTEKAA